MSGGFIADTFKSVSNAVLAPLKAVANAVKDVPVLNAITKAGADVGKFTLQTAPTKAVEGAGMIIAHDPLVQLASGASLGTAFNARKNTQAVVQGLDQMTLPGVDLQPVHKAVDPIVAPVVGGIIGGIFGGPAGAAGGAALGAYLTAPEGSITKSVLIAGAAGLAGGLAAGALSGAGGIAEAGSAPAYMGVGTTAASGGGLEAAADFGAGLGAGVGGVAGSAPAYMGVGSTAASGGGLEAAADFGGSAAADALGGVGSGLNDVMPGAESMYTSGTNAPSGGIQGLSSGTGGPVGTGNVATMLNTGDLPQGATMAGNTGTVTLANGVEVPGAQAARLGGAALNSLQSVAPDVAQQALAAQAAAGAPLSGADIINVVNKVRSGMNVMNAISALTAGGGGAAAIAGAGGGGGGSSGGGAVAGAAGAGLLASLAASLGIDPSIVSAIGNLGLTAAQEALLIQQLQETKGAYQKTPQDTQAENYQTGLANTATALQQGVNNPQFQQLLAAQKNLIMQGVQQSVTTMRNANNEQIARSGIGFLNPERRDETMARTLAQAEEGAQATAQNQVMSALQGAVTAGTPIANTLASQGAYERSANIAQNNQVQKIKLAEANAPLSLINGLFGTNVQPMTAPGTTATGTGATGTGAAGSGGNSTAMTALQTALNGIKAGGGAAANAATSLYNSLFGAATTGSLGAVSGTDLGTGIGDAASSLTGGIGSGAAMAPDILTGGGSASDITDLLMGGNSAAQAAAAASDAGMLPDVVSNFAAPAASAAEDFGSMFF